MGTSRKRWTSTLGAWEIKRARYPKTVDYFRLFLVQSLSGLVIALVQALPGSVNVWASSTDLNRYLKHNLNPKPQPLHPRP